MSEPNLAHPPSVHGLVRDGDGGFRRTAGQTAAHLIRQKILSGDLAPGTVLNQNDLAISLGMSRIPIRDALRSLAAEGLVDMRDNSPASVSALGLDDLAELYDLRLALEPGLCSRALSRITDADLEEMQRSLAELQQVSDPEEWLRLNDSFHEILYRRSGRPRSIEIVRQTRQATARYTRIYHLFDRPTVEVEHRLIFEAARAGHSRRLAALVAAHLSDGYETMLRYLARQEGFPIGEEDDVSNRDSH